MCALHGARRVGDAEYGGEGVPLLSTTGFVRHLRKQIRDLVLWSLIIPAASRAQEREE